MRSGKKMSQKTKEKRQYGFFVKRTQGVGVEYAPKKTS